jgi:hypothetical protein
VKPEITARLTKVTLEFAGKRRSFQLIVAACLVGVKDEAIKKAPGERIERRNRLSPTEKSDLPTSTESAAHSGSTSVN